jgi:hypothetical protein
MKFVGVETAKEARTIPLWDGRCHGSKSEERERKTYDQPTEHGDSPQKRIFDFNLSQYRRVTLWESESSEA